MNFILHNSLCRCAKVVFSPLGNMPIYFRAKEIKFFGALATLTMPGAKGTFIVNEYRFSFTIRTCVALLFSFGEKRYKANRRNEVSLVRLDAGAKPS